MNGRIIAAVIAAILSIISGLMLNNGILPGVTETWKKLHPVISENKLDEIYAPVLENNRKKLEHIMEYGDEACSVYVSTSDSLSVHEKILDEIRTLSDSLCDGCETEHDKVKALAYWVAENVYYNHVAAETEVDSDTISLETTLSTRTTTCAGYSNLFSALCNMQGCTA